MPTWKQDRIYSFLWVGLIRNKDAGRKFFYDRESKMFFDLQLSDKNIYTLPDKYYSCKSYYPEDKYSDRIKLLEFLLDKVKSKSTDIFEFVKLENFFDDPDFYKPIEIANESAWDKHFKIGQEQFGAIKSVLDKNDIDIETSDILE